jgi:chromosome partitioning protein
MPRIGLLAQKGGAGKSTLAVHLSVLAGDAMLIDLDPQQSAAGWWRSRGAELPELATGSSAQLKQALAAITRGWVLVDTAPHAEEDSRIVAQAVDLVVIPTRPAVFDLRAIAPTVEIVKRAKTRAVIVLNAVPPSRTVAESWLTTEARQELQTYGLPVCPVAVGQRAALSYALNDGRSVTEFEPDGKAAAEMTKLWRWIRDQATDDAAGHSGRAA